MRLLPLALFLSLVTAGPGPPGRQASSALARRAAPGATLEFEATAYCSDGTTRSGVSARSGIAAADPLVLPVGSVVQVTTHDHHHSGVYTILDTGHVVKGGILDLFIRNCREATAFGRRLVKVKVLRRGWSPRQSVKR
jgi:3D (Asp-Asp-Asp) domain-containing protein